MKDWQLVYDSYQARQQGLREALCALGNGYFVTRGAVTDSSDDGVHYPGTYLAGGYNRQTTEIAGRLIENEDLVNLPNWLPLTIRIEDGDWFQSDQAELLDYCQTLEIRQGMLQREFRFRDAAGRITQWRERRIVSMDEPHLAALEIQLKAENWSGSLDIISTLDGRVRNNGVARYRALNGDHLQTLALTQPQADIVCLRSRTHQSRLEIVQAVRTRLFHGQGLLDPAAQIFREEDGIRQQWTIELSASDTLRVEKTLALYTSRDPAVTEPGSEAWHAAQQAPDFAALLDRHRLQWRQLWDTCDLAIATEHNEQATNLKLRLHVFHLLQSVSRHSIDSDIGVPARGWHGEAYRGHIFWDELFIFPFLSLHLPVLTRALLLYRYRRLPAARQAAQAAGLRGAMYPWQSGSNGREETQQVHLNPKSGRWIADISHRQRHINAAIAYNVWHYYQITEDHEFLRDYGAEMLLEIARFWASVSHYNSALDRYEIRHVMGPDEYHTAYPEADADSEGGLHNNAYTNIMASWVLSRALEVMELLSQDDREKLSEHVGLNSAEFEHWDEISRKLRVVFHDNGIISQFEGYGDLLPFDWQGYREKYGDIQRLDRILEAEGDTPNRYQVSKQADVLMLFYLFSADKLALIFERLGYPFDQQTIPRNIEYYLARSSHGSTLSFIVHSWVLARLRRPEAWPLFAQALDSDITDIQGGTTAEGIHLGAMAGAVDLVQRCFTGIETRAGVLHFDPCLPQNLRSLNAALRYREHTLYIRVNHTTLQIDSRPSTAQPITIAYREQYRTLIPGADCIFRLLQPEERRRDENMEPPRTLK